MTDHKLSPFIRLHRSGAVEVLLAKFLRSPRGVDQLARLRVLWKKVNP